MPVPVLPWNHSFQELTCVSCSTTWNNQLSSFLHRCGGQGVRWQSCKSRNIGSMPSHAFSCTTLNILRDMYIKTEGIQPICSTLFPLIYNSFFTAYTKSETGMNQTCFGVMELSMGPCGWFHCKWDGSDVTVVQVSPMKPQLLSAPATALCIKFNQLHVWTLASHRMISHGGESGKALVQPPSNVSKHEVSSMEKGLCVSPNVVADSWL